MRILFTKCSKCRSSCLSVNSSVHLSPGVHVLSSKPLNRFRAVCNEGWGLLVRIVQWPFVVLINAMRSGIIKPKRHLFACCVLSGVNCSFKWWNDGWMMDYVGYWEKRTWNTSKNHPRIFHDGLKKNHARHVRFEVLIEVLLRFHVLWDVTPCRLVKKKLHIDPA